MKMTKSQRERGSMVLELAVTLPLLALLAMMVAEGAGVLRAHTVLDNSAREGARLASLRENFGQIGDIQTAVADYAARNGLSLAASNVSVDQALLVPTAAGFSMRASRVSVTFSYPLQYLPVMPFSSIPNAITLSGAAVFRNLY